MRGCGCQAGLAGEQETRRAGKKVQDPGRDMMEAGSLCWCSKDLQMGVGLSLESEGHRIIES